MKKTKLILALLYSIKKTTIFAALLLSVVTLKAQANLILVTEYEPDTCFQFTSVEDSFTLDIDQDGTEDIYFSAYFQSPGLMICMYGRSDWDWTNSLEGGVLIDETTMINDSLHWHHNSLTLPVFPERTHFAFRRLAEDGYHYAWAHIYLGSFSRIFVSAMGYCTLPDYPILWGQRTGLSIEENNVFSTCSNLYPNPTTGIIHIEGENTSEVHVFNALGQVVKTVQNTNEVSLEGLPQGVYLLRVRDAEGTVFAKRVIVCR